VDCARLYKAAFVSKYSNPASRILVELHNSQSTDQCINTITLNYHAHCAMKKGVHDVDRDGGCWLCEMMKDWLRGQDIKQIGTDDAKLADDTWDSNEHDALVDTTVLIAGCRQCSFGGNFIREP
jgi:hypothetical protein